VKQKLKDMDQNILGVLCDQDTEYDKFDESDVYYDETTSTDLDELPF
jgi:hypothetical protein